MYSHYLPKDDEGHTYRYNAVARRPVSPGFNERTNNLLNRNNSGYYHTEEEETPYYMSKRFTNRQQRETSPFQTAEYIPSTSRQNYFDNTSNHRRSGHFYMTTVDNKYDDYDYDYNRNKVNKINIKNFFVILKRGLYYFLQNFSLLLSVR